jgi:hypothetical protein
MKAFNLLASRKGKLASKTGACSLIPINPIQSANEEKEEDPSTHELPGFRSKWHPRWA